MPYLRFKRFKYLNSLAPHAVVCASGNRYLWKGDNEGATSVPNKMDVEELLNSLDGRPCDYEVCWEKYGVAFDAQGVEIQQPASTPPLFLNQEEPRLAATVSEAVTEKRSPGRPKKSS